VREPLHRRPHHRARDARRGEGVLEVQRAPHAAATAASAGRAPSENPSTRRTLLGAKLGCRWTKRPSLHRTTPGIVHVFRAPLSWSGSRPGASGRVLATTPAASISGVRAPAAELRLPSWNEISVAAARSSSTWGRAGGAVMDARGPCTCHATRLCIESIPSIQSSPSQVSQGPRCGRAPRPTATHWRSPVRSSQSRAAASPQAPSAACTASATR
jgi:hypothetical protein